VRGRGANDGRARAGRQESPEFKHFAATLRTLDAKCKITSRRVGSRRRELRTTTADGPAVVCIRRQLRGRIGAVNALATTAGPLPASAAMKIAELGAPGRRGRKIVRGR
jgi:hypothetical protein